MSTFLIGVKADELSWWPWSLSGYWCNIVRKGSLCSYLLIVSWLPLSYLKWLGVRSKPLFAKIALVYLDHRSSATNPKRSLPAQRHFVAQWSSAGRALLTNNLPWNLVNSTSDNSETCLTQPNFHGPAWVMIIGWAYLEFSIITRTENCG